MEPFVSGMLIICLGVPVVVGFTAMLVFDAVMVLRGHRSIFNRSAISPPKPAPKRQ